MADTAPLWFFGTPAFAEEIVRSLFEDGRNVSLVVCQPDRPKGRGHEVQQCEVKQFAEREETTVYQPESLRKDEEARSFLTSLAGIERPDVAIVASYGQILPKWLLDLPRKGFVNVHASLLPRWRGASPIAHAIWAGDRETGVCLMHVVEALDAGPVFSCKNTVIEATDDTPSLEKKLARAGAGLLLKDLDAILEGKLTAEPQSETGLVYAPRMLKKHGLVDWSRPAAEIERQVRALRPWPGTSTRAKGKQLRILSVEVTSDEGAPGEVILCEDDLVVACGQGALKLLEVQLEGKKAMSAAAFLRGFELKKGERLEGSPEPNPAPK